MKAKSNTNKHKGKYRVNKKSLDRKGLYGLGKGLWKEDAQEYINRLRENRHL